MLLSNPFLRKSIIYRAEDATLTRSSGDMHCPKDIKKMIVSKGLECNNFEPTIPNSLSSVADSNLPSGVCLGCGSAFVVAGALGRDLLRGGGEITFSRLRENCPPVDVIHEAKRAITSSRSCNMTRRSGSLRLLVIGPEAACVSNKIRMRASRRLWWMAAMASSSADGLQCISRRSDIAALV